MHIIIMNAMLKSDFKTATMTGVIDDIEVIPLHIEIVIVGVRICLQTLIQTHQIHLPYNNKKMASLTNGGPC